MNLEIYDVCYLKEERYEYNIGEILCCITALSSAKQEPTLEVPGDPLLFPGSFYENMTRLKPKKAQKVAAIAMDYFSLDCK
jgi:hypothetical protein